MDKNQLSVKKDNPVYQRHMAQIKAVLFEAQARRGEVAEAAPPPNPAALLVTPAQAEALAKMQALCKEVTKLGAEINNLALSFELAMPRMVLPEIVQRLGEIDLRIVQAAWAARQLGVRPVVSKCKLMPLPAPTPVRFVA